MNKKVAIAAGLGLVAFLILVFAIGQTRESTEKTRESTETGEVISQASSLYNSAISLQSKDELEKATKLYQELIKQFPDFKQISDVEKRLWDVNIKILFSAIVTERDFTYKVEPGDTLGKIAARYSTTVDLIMRSNNLKNDLIRPGNRLKISAAIYNVIVDKSQNTLTLKQDDEILKVYTVATGKYNSTPTGTFKIVEKLIDPPWYKQGEGMIPADSPKNVLGSRWLGLSEPKYGIHGCASEKDLGSQVTDGCVRMADPEVQELFTILPRGTEVIIVD